MDISQAFYQIENIYKLLNQHTKKKKESISLIPTENLLSPLASYPLSTDLVNRYYLTDSTIWEFPQTKFIRKISDICDNALKALFNVSFVNARPISGLNCMTIIIAALTKPGQIFYSISPIDGGHGATSFVAKRLGLKTFFLPFDNQTLDIDFLQAEKDFSINPPNFIYIDLSNFLFPISLRKLKSLSSPDTRLYFDCSQILGLLMDEKYFNPLVEGLPLIGGSTHKTFPGPQKGIILSNSLEVMNIIQQYTDSFVSSHHVNSLVSLCVTCLEMQEFGKDYASQILLNSKHLGQKLSELDIAVQKRGAECTGSHQLWIDSSPYGNSASRVVHELEEHNIVVNCARIPTIQSKGIRIGTTEVTRLFMKEREMEIIANLMADVLLKRRGKRQIKSDVTEFSKSYSKPHYCFDCTPEMIQKFTSVCGIPTL